MRSIARVASASSYELLLPKRTGNLAATWEGELDAEPATNAVYAQQAINIYELKCYVDASNRLLEDSAFDINAELALDFSQAFGQKEGAAFVNGTGSSYKQPLGLINATIPRRRPLRRRPAPRWTKLSISSTRCRRPMPRTRHGS